MKSVPKRVFLLILFQNGGAGSSIERQSKSGESNFNVEMDSTFLSAKFTHIGKARALVQLMTVKAPNCSSVRWPPLCDQKPLHWTFLVI